MRVLAWLREHPALWHGPIFSVELKLVVGPCADDHVERFPPHAPRFRGIDSKAFQLGARCRAAGSKLDASIREKIEDRNGLGRTNRMVVRLREKSDAVAESKRGSLGSNMTVEHFRIGTVRELFEKMMLNGPEAIEPGLFAEDGLFDGLLIRVEFAVSVPRPGNGDLIEKREFH